jgi:hypothetical protein
MRRKNHFIYLMLGIVTLLLLQCSDSEAGEQAAPTAVETGTATATPTALSTATASPTPSPLPTATATASPSPTVTATPTFTPTPTPALSALTVTLQKLCIHATGDLPWSRADIYFSLRLLDPGGISHSIREVPQPQLIKKAASVNCTDPLPLAINNRSRLPDRGTCLRVEGEFERQSAADDTMVGKIDEPICFRQANGRQIGTRAISQVVGGLGKWF